VSAQTYSLSSGEVLKDPTEPAKYTRKATKAKQLAKKTYVLNYIIHSGQNKKAMINGQKVIEGAYVSGAKVSKIEQASVTLSVNGQKRVLRLNKLSGIRKN
jgi:hypothetical protein